MPHLPPCQSIVASSISLAISRDKGHLYIWGYHPLLNPSPSHIAQGQSQGKGKGQGGPQAGSGREECVVREVAWMRPYKVRRGGGVRWGAGL